MDMTQTHSEWNYSTGGNNHWKRSKGTARWGVSSPDFAISAALDPLSSHASHSKQAQKGAWKVFDWVIEHKEGTLTKHFMAAFDRLWLLRPQSPLYFRYGCIIPDTCHMTRLDRQFNSVQNPLSNLFEAQFFIKSSWCSSAHHMGIRGNRV